MDTRGIRKQQINDILQNAKEQKLIVQTVPKSKLDNLANAPHQGVVCILHHMNMLISINLFNLKRIKRSLSTVVILDGLEDPHNLGSILRTADASGVDGVIIPKRRSVALTQTVAKASTGAIQHVPVMRVTNLAKQLTN